MTSRHAGGTRSSVKSGVLGYDYGDSVTTAALATSAFIGELNLGHLLTLTGVELADVVVVRHTYTTGGLETAADLPRQASRLHAPPIHQQQAW